MKEQHTLMRISHLKKQYDDNLVLNDISLDIHDEVTCILGPSGAGKSTFLRCLNLLEQPTGGDIIYNGHSILEKGYDIRKMREEVSMVFQHFNLFPLRTVVGNVMLALQSVKKMNKNDAHDIAMEMLKKVDMAQKADKYPDMLSGGQQQRVAIARTLAMNPKIILFDEPTSALDPELVGGVLDVMRNRAENGMAMVIVTHEMAFARDVSDRIIFMADSIVQEDASPNDFFTQPKTDRAHAFLKRFLS